MVRENIGTPLPINNNIYVESTDGSPGWYNHGDSKGKGKKGKVKGKNYDRNGDFYYGCVYLGMMLAPVKELRPWYTVVFLLHIVSITYLIGMIYVYGLCGQIMEICRTN